MQSVVPAAGTELVQLQPPRVVSLVLPGAVRALLAFGARQRDDRTVLGLGHGIRSFRSFPSDTPNKGRSPGEAP